MSVYPIRKFALSMSMSIFVSLHCHCISPFASISDVTDSQLTSVKITPAVHESFDLHLEDLHAPPPQVSGQLGVSGVGRTVEGEQYVVLGTL